MRLFRWIITALKNPRELSTIFPSSRFLARTIADQVDFTQPRTIAELGPGDGALTGPIVERMDPESQLLLIEIIDNFCQELRRQYSSEEQSGEIEILNRSAAELDIICEERQLEGLDYVISGLPLTTLPDPLSSEIIDKTHSCLKPGGKYIQFQYSRDYQQDIEQVFGPVKLIRVWLNIFPAWVYVATKKPHQ